MSAFSCVFHDESSITITIAGGEGGYESAIAPIFLILFSVVWYLPVKMGRLLLQTTNMISCLIIFILVRKPLRTPYQLVKDAGEIIFSGALFSTRSYIIISSNSVSLIILPFS